LRTVFLLDEVNFRSAPITKWIRICENSYPDRDADIEHVFDCGDEMALRRHGMDAAALADPTWRNQMKISGEARTQRFARQLTDTGCCGLLVKSFASAASGNDLNLVLWTSGNAAPARLI
jgi:hypothetical protein